MSDVANLDPEDAALLMRAWPERLEPSEVRAFASLPEGRRQKVRARLRVLLRIEDMRRGRPNVRVDVKALASQADLTVDGLFSIRRNWDEDRSIRSIAPYLGRAERQATQRADDDPVVVAARDLLVAQPELPDSQLASDLHHRFGLSVPTMIRLVRRLRREDAADPARVREVFGRSLLIDLSAIDRVALENGKAIVLALVVERSVGLVLGWATATVDGDTIAAQRDAVAMAMRRINDGQWDVEGTGASVELTIGDGPHAEAAFACADRLAGEGIDLRVNSRGPRRYGQRIVTLLGKRLGSLWWRPRSSAPGSLASPLDAARQLRSDDVPLAIATEVESHNGRVVDNLLEGGVRPGWGVANGMMTTALRSALAVLSPE